MTNTFRKKEHRYELGRLKLGYKTESTYFLFMLPFDIFNVQI